MRLFGGSSSGAVLGSVCLAFNLLGSVTALELDLSDKESIKQAAKSAAKGMTKYYTGDQPGDTAGNLPEPYYWWEAGAMFGALIDYWFYTGDDTYNAITIQGMMHQTSPTQNFMPSNQSRTLGNDDQAFWGIAAMAAAERKFPNPPDDQPQWLALAQAVFNSQTTRWNTESCGGGLKWQIFPFNDGYNYKNTVSNGCFFNLAARLALYTGNNTYAEWAEKTWDWMRDVGLMTEDWKFYDGTDDLKNCTEFDKVQWTYNAGLFLHGSASMYKFKDQDKKWEERINEIIGGMDIFFKGDIMYEVACEPPDTCKVDQRSFKAYLARWMAATTQLAPSTKDFIMPKLAASARGAAKACTGGGGGEDCGLRWTVGKYDGPSGVGEQMAALEVIQSNLIEGMPLPVSEDKGGISEGDPGAGFDDPTVEPPQRWEDIGPITTADKAGAGVITTLAVAGMVLGSYWTSVVAT